MPMHAVLYMGETNSGHVAAETRVFTCAHAVRPMPGTYLADVDQNVLCRPFFVHAIRSVACHDTHVLATVLLQSLHCSTNDVNVCASSPQGMRRDCARSLGMQSNHRTLPDHSTLLGMQRVALTTTS